MITDGVSTIGETSSTSCPNCPQLILNDSCRNINFATTIKSFIITSSQPIITLILMLVCCLFSQLEIANLCALNISLHPAARCLSSPSCFNINFRFHQIAVEFLPPLLPFIVECWLFVVSRDFLCSWKSIQINLHSKRVNYALTITLISACRMGNCN